MADPSGEKKGPVTVGAIRGTINQDTRTVRTKGRFARFCKHGKSGDIGRYQVISGAFGGYHRIASAGWALREMASGYAGPFLGWWRCVR